MHNLLKIKILKLLNIIWYIIINLIYYLNYI
jgi:hypothetical protein